MKNSRKKSSNPKDPLKRDLSDLFDRNDWKKVNYELLQKNKTITLRLNEDLLQAIKEQAAEEGIDYQKWIRESLMNRLNRSA